MLQPGGQGALVSDLALGSRALMDLSDALSMAEENGINASAAANVNAIFEQAIQTGEGDCWTGHGSRGHQQGTCSAHPIAAIDVQGLCHDIVAVIGGKEDGGAG